MADPIAAGHRDLLNVSVDEGQTVTQDDWVWRADEAVIYKVGAGNLTFTPSAVLDSSAFGIGVRDGNVTFAGGSASEMEAPVAVLNTARLWMDATRNYVLSSGTTFVSEWHDVRETKAEAPFDYPRAVSRWNTSTAANAVANALPEVTTLDNGKQAFWFGGYRSGRYMAFLSPSESDPAATPFSLSDITEAFIVYSFTNTFTYLFGKVSGTSDFHPGSSNMNPSDTFAGKVYACKLSPAWWLDGVPFDASETAVKSGCHLIDYEFSEGGATAATIFDGGTSFSGDRCRQGGDHLCEFLLFTNKLSSADRVKVQTYLLNKWKSFSMDSAADVTVASGASVTMDSSNGAFPLPLEISGNGSIRKTGSGNAVVGYVRDAVPFAGRLSVENGSATLHDDIAFAADSGMRIVASNALDGANVSVESASAGNLVKDGEGTIRLDAVPDGVSAISVSGGTLILAPPASNDLLAAGSDVGASITNSSFEIEASTAISGNTLNGEERGGWSFSYSPDYAFSDSYAILLNCVDMTDDPWHLGTEVPVGKSVLGLRADIQASTWIDVPHDGLYELSFWIKAKDANSKPMYLKVLIGEDDENLREIAAITYASKTWRHFTWRIPALTAGRRLFVLRQMAYTGQEQNAHLIDDLKLSYLGRDDGTIPVPNGGFEAYDRTTYANMMSFSAATAEGWTFTQPAWTNKTAVGIVREGVNVSEDLSGPNLGQMRDGLVQLLMCSSGGTARVSFAAPKAGTYRLRADAGVWCKAYLYDGSPSSAATVAASVKVGDGAETSIGSVSRSGLMMKESVWPTQFIIPNAGDTVTLTVTSTQMKNGMLLDNFTLVPVQPDDELVSNGSFTSPTSPWVYEAIVKGEAAYASKPKAQRYGLSGNENTQGHDKYDDNYCLRLIDTGRASQTVDIAEPGRYCLRFYSRMRFDSRYPNEPYRFGKNTLHVYIARSGVTNSLAKILCDTTNFVGQCIRFDVPAAASDWSLGFEGMNVSTASSNDKGLFVDGVSLKRCTDEPSSAMSIPKTLAVSVATDAKLRLDFSGTSKIGELSLGGRRVTGFVSSATHPDYISGSGALEITPRGMVFIFR